MTLWSGRMGDEPAAAMMRYSASIGYDIRLAPFDIAASIAHVRGLGRAGVLSTDEVEELSRTLEKIGDEFETGTFAPDPSEEDVHTAIERRATELAGDLGRRIHTGRSRNDQVATALRLYAREALRDVVDAVCALEDAILVRAEGAGPAYLPGYTHLQRAQPVLLAHALLAHGWPLARDVDRLLATAQRLEVSPLGAGALGGSSLALDPAGTAAELSFRESFENSLDAVSDRDFVAEILFDLALLGVHLSRLGEEIVIFSSEEFGFYRLADAWSTGSSMLPQKKNPDVAELARGKSGRLIGHLAGFLATLKALPLSYNRDLQEDKEPLFDAVDQTLAGLDALRGVVGSIVFDADRMRTAADSDLLCAVDLAELLVGRNVPFRDAHGIVGRLVRRSLEEGVALRDLVAEDTSLGPEATAIFAPGSSVARRRTAGGSGTDAVARQIDRFRARLDEDRARSARAARRV